MKISRVFASVAIASALAVSASAQSLADAAREQRANKPETPQAKVYTNDNLPTGGGITVIGAPAPAAPATPAKASSTTLAAAATSAADSQKAADKLKADVQAQKDEISRLERELDVATREWKLQQATYYADAGDQLRTRPPSPGVSASSMTRPSRSSRRLPMPSRNSTTYRSRRANRDCPLLRPNSPASARKSMALR